MLIKTQSVLNKLDGEPLIDEKGKLVTFRTIAVDVLLMKQQDDIEATGKKSFEAYEIARRIQKKDEVNLKTEECATLKKRLGNSNYQNIIVGRMFDLIEGNVDDEIISSDVPNAIRAAPEPAATEEPGK